MSGRTQNGIIHIVTLPGGHKHWKPNPDLISSTNCGVCGFFCVAFLQKLKSWILSMWVNRFDKKPAWDFFLFPVVCVLSDKTDSEIIAEDQNIFPLTRPQPDTEFQAFFADKRHRSKALSQSSAL